MLKAEKAKIKNTGRLRDSNPARSDSKPSLYRLRHHRGLRTSNLTFSYLRPRLRLDFIPAYLKRILNLANSVTIYK